MGRVWFRARSACPPPFLVPVCGVRVRAGPGSWLCPAILGWVVGVCFLRFFIFALWCRLLGVPVPGLVVPVPPSPCFRAGLLALFFFRAVCLHVSVSLFPVGRCSWLGVAGFGWVVPLCLFGGPVFGAFWGGGLAASGCVGGRFGGCGLFSRPPPSSLRFFWGGGAACALWCVVCVCGARAGGGCGGVCCVHARACVRCVGGAFGCLSSHFLAWFGGSVWVWGLCVVALLPSRLCGSPPPLAWVCWWCVPPPPPLCALPPLSLFRVAGGGVSTGAVPGPSRLWWVGGGPCRRLGSLPLVFPLWGPMLALPVRV